MSKMGDFFKGARSERRKLAKQYVKDVLSRPVKLTIVYLDGQAQLELLVPWGTVREIVFKASLGEFFRERLPGFVASVLEVVPCG